MKKRAKFFAILLALITVASTISTFAFGEFGSEVATYDKYGYYAYFDFEEYDHTDHFEYFRSDAKNSGGLACDPFDFLLNGQGVLHGTGSAVKDGDNTYYHFVQGGSGGAYPVLAVFGMVDENGNDALLGDSAEISFRLRMSKDQIAGKDKKMALVNLRRGNDYTQNVTYLYTDIYGNLYAPNNDNLIYTNGDGKTVGGTGEFITVSLRWYDVTNSYSVFVNGDPVAEAIPLTLAFTSSDMVVKTYDDDFNVDSLTIKDITGEGSVRAIELMRASADAFAFDVDDIKLSRVETAQGGAVYYENSFEGAQEGISNQNGLYTYGYPNGTDGIVREVEEIEDRDNRYLYVPSGKSIRLFDKYYQAFLQGNTVVEFSIKGKATHTSGKKALIRFNDARGNNMYKCLWVDPDGYIYAENYDPTRIEGYRLSETEWLHIAVVAIKNTSNLGKFSTFSSSSTKSTVNDSYTFSYYINGNFVGVTSSSDFVRFGGGSWDFKKMPVTASNYRCEITDHTTALEIDETVTLVDDTTTANHKIYKSVVDGVVTYYDVTFDENGDQTGYSKMVLVEQITNDDSDDFEFFTDTAFNGKIDNIKIYEGTAPESAYAAVNSSAGGAVLDVDFSKFLFPTGNGNNRTARTNNNGSDVLGTFMMSGSENYTATHKDANGEEVTKGTTDKTEYTTLNLSGPAWFDFFVPMAKKTDGGFDVTYSFETEVKNIGFGEEDAPSQLSFFSLRLEDNEDDNSQALLTVDSDFCLYMGGSTSRPLYLGGEKAKIDNTTWNKLRVDVRFVKTSEGGALEASYYLNNQLLSLSDGSKADKVTSFFGADLLGRIGTDNVRLRYFLQIGNEEELAFDAKTLTITAEEKAIYTTVETEQASFVGRVTAIEFTVPKYTSVENTDRYEALTLVKSIGDTSSKLPLVVVDPVSGKVYIGIGGQHYELLNSSGNSITVPENGLPMAIVYNDADGLARYYVSGSSAYVDLPSIGLTAAAEIGIYDSNFTLIERVGSYGYVVFGGFGNDARIMNEADYKLNTYNINNGDTAEIIALQQNGITDGIRIIAGVDTRYYNKVGFEMETFIGGVSKGVKDISHNKVFSSVVANDRTVTAKSQGYNYLAAAIVTEMPSKITADTYITLRSYTEIAGFKHYDKKIDIIITSDGCYFCQDGVIYQNDFNDITELPSNFVNSGSNSTVALDSKGMIDFDSTADTFSTYYLDQYVGSDYLVQADITVDDTTEANGYFGLVGRLQSSSKYIEAGVRLDGGGWFEADGGGGSLGGFDITNMGLSSLEIGNTYTLSLICKDSIATFFVDGTPVAEATIPEGYETGKVGVCTSGVSISVDNFIVRKLDSTVDDYILYENNFDGLTEVPAEWDINKSATRENKTTNFKKSIENGQLKLSNSGNIGSAVEIKTEFDYTDYVYEFDITFNSNARAGLLFGLHDGVNNDGGRHAYFSIRTDSNAATSVSGFVDDNSNNGGGSYPAIGSSAALASKPINGTKYHLKMVVIDGIATFYVNNVKVSTFDIKNTPGGYDWSTGKFGVFFRDGEVLVDNVRLYKTIDKYEITDTSDEGTRIRVATFNIGDFSTYGNTNGTGTDGAGTEITKQQYIDVLKKVDADIWAFQEDAPLFDSTTGITAYEAIYSAIYQNSPGKNDHHDGITDRAYNNKSFLTGYELLGVEKVKYNTRYYYDHDWFLAGKVKIEGIEVCLITVHFDWRDKNKRDQQISDVIAYAENYEYCIILGDINSENSIGGSHLPEGDEDYINPGSVSMWQIDWQKFIVAGYEPANGGRLGTYGTLVDAGAVKSPHPWDCIFVSSNIKIKNVEVVVEPWMDDHAIVAADLELYIDKAEDCEHTLSKIVTPPTCEGEGYTLTVCQNCGYSVKGDIVPAHGHAYGDWVITTPIMPNETDGLKISRCVNCDSQKSASIDVVTEGTLGSKANYRIYEDGTLLVFGEGATKGCNWNGSAQPYLEYRDSITRAIVGEGITELGEAVFAKMPNLKEYEFPTTLKKLNNNVFVDSFSKEITKFVFPESVEYIGICAIGPYSLSNAVFTDVYIENPNTTLVKDNGFLPFNKNASGCTGLTIYSYGESNSVSTFAKANGIKYIDLESAIIKGTTGNLNYEFFDGTLTLSSSNGSASIPEALHEIMGVDRALVKKLVITADITELPTGCFKDYTALTDVSLPDSLEVIGAEAFATTSTCDTALNIDIKENIKSIASDFLNNRSNVSVLAYKNTVAEDFSATGVKVTLRNSLKILLIGNSLSQDAADYLDNSRPSLLYDMIKSMTGDSTYVEIAVLYSGAKTAGWHATVAELESKSYQFQVISDDTNGQWTGYNNYTTKMALCFDDWDIVTIQPYAAEAQTGIGGTGDTDTNSEKTSPVKAEKFYSLENSLPYLLDYINTHAEDADVYYYLTWSIKSYADGFGESIEDNYIRMLNVAKTALGYKGTETQKGFEGLIPVGTAIQNARSTFLNKISYTDPTGNTNYNQYGLLRDGLHLSVEVGRYIAGLSFAEILVPDEYRQEGYVLPMIDSSVSGEYVDEYTRAATLSVEKMLESLNKLDAEQYAPVEIEGYTEFPTN